MLWILKLKDSHTFLQKIDEFLVQLSESLSVLNIGLLPVEEGCNMVAVCN